MAVRRESVRLELDDQFTTPMAKAAAAAALLKRELDGLNGKRVSRELGDTAKSTDKIGASSRKSSADIDKLSGRLRLLTDAAVTIGPALIPLGAATIPLLTGALAGLGAAAGGIGTAVLAFQGLGDAIKSIDEYRLEPTVENLAAMRAEAAKLGPAGADFARFIADLEPQIRQLQMTARSGLFPGIEDGIESLLTRGPQINSIISDIARGMGDLARDAGASLGGDDFDAFFEYLETDARPTLESFARSIGNVALGVSNLLVGFAPASRDFTGGLEDMTKAFADWSKSLDNNQSFQDFLSYVRQAGPQAVEFLGAVAGAISGLLQAAAPIGNAVLPALTALANVFGAIASSPVGGAIYGAVAAFVAINRVASIASSSLERVSASADKTQSSFSRYAALGAGVLGVAGAVGALADSINRIDATALDRSLTALSFGDVTPTIDKVVDSLDQLDNTSNKIDLAKGLKFLTLGLSGDTSLEKFADNIDQVDQKLAQMVESGNAEQAADLFTRVKTLAGAQGVSTEETTKRFDAYAQALKNADAAANQAKGGFTGLLDTLVATAGAAQDLTQEIAALNGYFDKRDAVRAYKDSIDTLKESLKDGFSREDAANIDGIGRSILQVAEKIKNPGAKADFLAGARDQLSDLANNSGPRAAAAIQQVIDKFDSKGLTNPPPIKLTADQKNLEAALVKSRRAVAGLSNLKAEPKIGADTGEAENKIGDVEIKLRRTGGMSVTPKIGADNNASGIIAQVRAALDALNGKVATTYVRTIRQEFVNPQARANGGQVFGAGGPKDDKVPAMLSNREYVQPVAAVDKYGVDFMESVRTLRFAEGGTPNKASRNGGGRGNSVLIPFDVGSGAKGLSRALKELEAQVTRSTKAYDKEQQALESLQGQRSSISGAVSGRFDVDLGNALNPLASIASATNQASQFPAIIQSLNAAGLTGPALEQVIQQLSFGQLQSLASDPTKAGQYQSALSGLYAAQGSAGSTAGDVLYGQAIAAQSAKADQANALLRDQIQQQKMIEKAIKALDASNKEGHRKTRDAADKGGKKGDRDAANARRRARR